MSDPVAGTSPPPPVKCLVWDLDNTLWRGTLLEGDRPVLRPSIREVIVELDARGVLHAVASRNDHDEAWKALHGLGIADYFVAARIGWGRKSDSVREIAEQLDFAPRTVAFIDDQHTERAEVRFHLPEVRCYRAESATGLLGLPEFSPAKITADSARRREMYRAKERRESSRAAFTGPDEEFVRSLEMVLELRQAGESDLARVEELTLRTSQMNATGVHYSESDLRTLLDDPEHDVLVATLDDRFGTHGAVGIMLVRPTGPVWHLKLLATSCRVVSFGVGSIILNWLIDRAAAAGAHLVADFRRTDRNRIMEVTYRFAGFAEDPCACHGAVGPERLHLRCAPQPPPSTMRVLAPDLVRTEGGGLG
ncbi:HAD-IIIC family phosphatase [Amycolatopsis sp. CA-230715]|uniref:HAD-IIIC family phosphatase n=1 Tax=Amycolatopsis sp. CA-230715 TaxID=2745196 RepID=UPI001C32198A|nr:HAD-IIIC family phosphatase [Amycolatopsis sp. CA-230715]QWF84526.1 hypothetical protein HUW46_07976 [Amycolatopsis sp. CA-230715]